ncbi:MAG TPA: methionine--tRNA ligase [Polyangiaceae bacterium]|jgi:methionyl-tRNA synthetase
MARPFYVTTPIYYVNDVPHLGTAYTTIVADALRRYERLRGRDARMLTGTDEHGQKIERAATAQNQSPIAFVDQVSARFREAWPKLLVEADDFIRTTEPRHEKLVQSIWERVAKKGDIYLGEHEGLYCFGCEEFKTEKELLPGNVCPLHQRPTERLKEPTYLFKLKDYEQELLDFYDAHPGFIQPETRRNEVIAFVKGGLRDLSVSRTSFSWGVPVPGDPKHVMYVWFDALANYWTALGEQQSKYWEPNGEVVHLVGKDILRFHAVYWPAFLMSAGLPLPTKVFAHGFLTIDGQKMSKSLRNAVDPVRLAETEEIGGPDGLRYQLLRYVAFGQDGDFDHRAMIERYNADLGKNLGNLLSRTLGLCAKLAGNKVPSYQPTDLEHEFEKQAHALIQSAANAWTELAPHRALEETLALSSLANQYVDRAAPWAEAKKGNQARVDTTLALLLETLRVLSVLVWPAIPRKADALRAQLALAPIAPRVGNDSWPTKLAFDRAGQALGAASALFPTVDKDGEKALLERLQPKTEGAPAAPAAVPGHPSAVPAVATIPYEQFAAVDLRVGLVKTATKVPKKDKLLQLEVDLGEEKPRTIIAGLALSFAPEQLVGQRVIVVANLAPRDFGKGLVSHGMLLAAGPSEALQLATAPDTAAPGAKLK